MNSSPVLWMIIPCYNEEQVLPVTAPMFLDKLTQLSASGRISPESRILFVNDGSADGTWDFIRKMSLADPHFTGICLSRNRGHQNALLAGMTEAKDKCDIAITIDCDGQDDIDAMDQMVDEYLKGSEIVYGVRNDRSTDSTFKRNSALAYYSFLKHMGVEVVYDHADYRLVSARVLREFDNYREVNLFLRGMFPLVGFKSTSVYYKRHERKAGKTHYPLKKMLALAFDGVTSLSIKPVRMIAGIGAGVSLLGFIGVLWAIIAFFVGHTVSGWASIVCIVCFLGGIQLLSLGIIGEYVGKTYLETKRRPRFIISERTSDEEESTAELTAGDIR